MIGINDNGPFGRYRVGGLLTKFFQLLAIDPASV